jgi:hypothetical protein
MKLIAELSINDGFDLTLGLVFLIPLNFFTLKQKLNLH